MDTVAFSANVNSNTRACTQLRVADDDIYGTSPVPVYTVVLSISSPNSRVTVGDINQTTITVNDDDGMSVISLDPGPSTESGLESRLECDVFE